MLGHPTPRQNNYKEIVIDSNVLLSSSYGISMQYADLGSISHNDIRPSPAVNNTWYGCSMRYCSRIQVDGNHVSSSYSSDDDMVERQYAFYVYDNDSSMFSNNEIILSENMNDNNTGIYMYAGNGNTIVNNSIYVRNENTDDEGYIEFNNLSAGQATGFLEYNSNDTYSMLSQVIPKDYDFATHSAEATTYYGAANRFIDGDEGVQNFNYALSLFFNPPIEVNKQGD